MAMQTFTGRQHLHIDIANSFGLDKLDWDDRLSWFDDNRSRLRHMVHEAKEPAMFTAGLNALDDVGAGKPVGFGVSLDATASGIQWFSVLDRCRKSALTCNVLDAGRRMDAYTEAFQHMKTLVKVEAELKRESLKDSVMKAYYGSTAIPAKYFTGETLQAFYTTLKTTTPGAWGKNVELLSFWSKTATQNKWVMPDGFDVRANVEAFHSEHLHFKGRPYELTYKVNAPSDYGRSISPNMIHSIDAMAVREITRMAMHDPAQVIHVLQVLARGSNGKALGTRSGQWVRYLNLLHRDSGYLSARIIEHVNDDTVGLLSPEARADLYRLLEHMPRRTFQVLAVHDCFRVTPNAGSELRKLYNYVLSSVARSNLYAFLAGQIKGEPVQGKPVDQAFADEVLEANYALS